MSAPAPVYQDVFRRLGAVLLPAEVRITSVRRLALLITGLLAARSCVLAQVAAELAALHVTRASCAEHVERRLRRTLNDARLLAATCYAPAVRSLLARAARCQRITSLVLAIDESAQADRVHLLRVSLQYWGLSLPLAWRIWPQNVATPEGAYLAAVDAVLREAIALLPPGVAVVVTADRGYEWPAFLDAVTAHRAHWLVRLKAGASTRYRDPRTDREGEARALVHRHVARPGQRWRARLLVYKDAGWRRASVVAVWAMGEAEPLVVLTDLPPRWSVLRLYDRRFWIEPGFRADKRRGWQWEQSQVQGLPHQEHLLLALAWATLLTVLVGVQEAERRLAEAAARGRPVRPQPAKQSVFTLGLRAVRAWLYRTESGHLPWHLPVLDAPTWTARWYAAQAHTLIFGQTVRP